MDRVCFEDTFEVLAVDSERFDRVSRIKAQAQTFLAEIEVDINTEIYPVSAKETLSIALAVATDENAYEAASRSGAQGLVDMFEYVMFGKVFKKVNTAANKVQVYASFGGLLMCLEGERSDMDALSLDDRLYLLVKKNIPLVVFRTGNRFKISGPPKSPTTSSSSSSQVPPYTWFVYRRPFDSVEVEARAWIRLSEVDSRSLEEAVRANTPRVSIDHGRYEALVSKRRLRCVYWEEPEWEIRRCAWFYRAVDNAVNPFSELDAQTVEEATQDLLSGKEEGPIDCELTEAKTIGIVQVGNLLIPSDKDRPARKEVYYHYYCVADNVPRKLAVYRGLPKEYPVLDDPESRLGTPSWLIIMTHGIGEALFNRKGDALLGGLRFRRHLHRLRRALNAGISEGGRVELLPLEWLPTAHSPEMVEAIDKVTLPTLERARDFINLALRDVLLYTQSDLRTKILDEVKEQAERKIKLFCEKNTEYANGLKTKQSGLGYSGHSLGAVIISDMLASDDSERLPPADCFFMFGAPVSLFRCVRGETTLTTLPCARCFNVYHPYDPIAYRLEPLLVDQTGSESLPPANVPHQGGQRLHVAISSIGNSIMNWWVGQKPEEKEGPLAEKVRALNGGFRVDWTLQTSAGEAASEWLSAVSSHFTYWTHEDVINFILEQLKAVGQAKRAPFI